MTAPSSRAPDHLHADAGLVRQLVLGVLVLVVALGGAAWWFVLRDDAPPEASLGDCAAPTTGDAPDTPDGDWTVQPDDDGSVFVGYRIDEQFGGETVTKTATGRTGEVAGTLLIAGDEVTEATVVANMAAISSNRTARDTAMRTKGLQTDEFPEATFTLTAPIALGQAPEVGRPIEATATGTLDLHGQERTIAIPIEACWTGLTIKLSGSAPIVLADYGIEQVETPIVDIAPDGELELELIFISA